MHNSPSPPHGTSILEQASVYAAKKKKEVREKEEGILKNIEEFSLADQELLLNVTVNSDLVLKYPLKLEYQKAFLKLILGKLEKGNLKGSIEIHDDFYSAYGRIISRNESNSEYFKHYVVDTDVISLKENINLISEGTTGLKTWQASLALSEWALKNKNYLKDKTILELGSGIGLTGLVIALKCIPKKYIFSDCHISVLKNLCQNIVTNTSENRDNFRLEDNVVLEVELKSSVKLSALNLPWEEVDLSICNKIGNIDIILAADVVYDSDLFSSLLNSLQCFAKYCKTKDIIFACTERNPETLNSFLKCIGEHFVVTEEKCPAQQHFIWSPTPQVKFFRFILK
ncbi:protein-lysine N-methyltransferase EEF2KMT [Sitophilus oryzae]|uniref:Protein-lysine N-methyltransferase EEF2KMT n=1 Tax=Sitophilus oryzae TaxID=7048 RepID=A0A6J2XL43_SITOR|nr:protein-lysine N-methyltransferase EEF2KMT [Sitophilus oryzae]